MRSLIVGLLMIFVVAAVSENADARGRRVEPTALLFADKVGVFPTEKTLSAAQGVTLRWGRQYWPLAEFGKCFAELRTPETTSWAYGNERTLVARVEWQGKRYEAHCWDDTAVGSRVFWSVVTD